MSDAFSDCSKEELQAKKKEIAKIILARALFNFFRKRSKKTRQEILNLSQVAEIADIDARIERFLIVAEAARKREKTKKNSVLFRAAKKVFFYPLDE